MTGFLAGCCNTGRLPLMSVLTQRLFSEIESAPEPVQAEVLDFLLFVKARHGSADAGANSGPSIQRTAGVCGGEACVRNTRIAVWMLAEARGLGMSDADLLQDYPGLNAGDLAEAWAYADSHPVEIEKAIRENHEA